MTPGDDLTTAQILVVDDSPANVNLLTRVLHQAGFVHVTGTTDPRSVLALVTSLNPDLILLDLHMPQLDGFAVLTLLGAQLPPRSFLPIVVLTADTTREASSRALAGGATDFLTAPYDAREVVLRVTNHLRTRRLHRAVQNQNAQLEERVAERTKELDRARSDLLERLALAGEFRDDQTHQHGVRVANLAARLAGALHLPAAVVDRIRRAAPLHDLGKIGIADEILLKPGKLTPLEFTQMQEHTVLGARLLAGGQSELIKLAEQLALTHHERWDGEGYPSGLAGAAIPLVSRVVSVADVFDALTHVRPYKTAWPVDQALAEIAAQRGRQFDPEVVNAFLPLLEPRT